MYDHRPALNEEVLTTLFVKSLPAEKMPEQVNKRVQQEVLAALKAWKPTNTTPKTFAGHLHLCQPRH
jgi:hypothetical protein